MAEGSDGKTYGVRLLLEPGELLGLQKAGLLPEDVVELVGMQEVSDRVCARFELQSLLAQGGRIQ